MSSHTDQQSRGADRLSSELITLILEHIHADYDRIIAVDRRQFLSVESFDMPRLPTGSARDIGRFRLASHRFADLGAQCLFNRVTVRLSEHGLARLEQLTQWPSLTQHVRKFSYLMPAFHMKGTLSSSNLLRRLVAESGTASVERLMGKIKEQGRLVDTGEDLRVFTLAFTAFTSLQHIQLLRVQDDDDGHVFRLQRQYQDDNELLLDWAPACSHASKTICTALIAARNTHWSRFSSPMMDPYGLESLHALGTADLSVLAERLTCLTLHFDEATQLNERMTNLSGLFHVVFGAAKNMQAIHVGFPAHAALDVPLSTIFHDVTWDRLVAFGIQGWKLDSNEILDLVYRHKDRLRGLRLRDVSLKDGSTWKEVLSGIRANLQALRWVSLRRIGYTAGFDASPHGQLGVEISDALLSDTESDTESVGSHSSNAARASVESSDDEDDGAYSDSEIGRSLADTDFDLASFDESANMGRVRRSSPARTSGDLLEDDGLTVTNARRKLWEQWVLGSALSVS